MPVAEIREAAHSCRGTEKTPVLVLVERDGNSVCHPLGQVTAKEIGHSALVEISTDSILMSDEARDYGKLGRQFPQHHTTNQNDAEYARSLENGLSVHSNC